MKFQLKKKHFGFDFFEEKSKIDFSEIKKRLDFGEEMAEVKIDMRKFFELRKKNYNTTMLLLLKADLRPG